MDPDHYLYPDTIAQLKRTMKTRSMSVKPSTHSPDSDCEMHRAIKMWDEKLVKKLLDNGDNLCYGVSESTAVSDIPTGNCFILAHSLTSWRFMKFLLSLDPEAGIAAKNSDGLTLLMLYAMQHTITEIQHLLELGADPNERLMSDGSTALMLAFSIIYSPTVHKYNSLKFNACYSQEKMIFAEKCQQIVDLLIQKGADVNICNKNRENVLHLAVKNRYTLQIGILQSLINAGVDPTVETNEHCTVLTYAMETFVELCKQFRSDTLAREVYPALQYLFNLPPFQSETFQFRCHDAERHPQVILLKHLSFCQMLTGEKSIFIDLISSNQNILTPELVVTENLEYTNHGGIYPFGPLALYLNHESYVEDSDEMPLLGCSIIQNLQYLMAVGFKCVNVLETISPLTIGLLHGYSHINYVMFAKSMINSGVHVEQRMFKCEANNQELNRLSDELCLPDALRMALSEHHLQPDDVLELVKLFLPHFAHPGWTLLPFVSHEKVDALFPFLSSCGALQHTALHNAVKAHILNSGLLRDENLYIFNAMNSCVPKLDEICRTMVRAQLARRACQHGNSLPALIKSVPPLVSPQNNLLSVSHILE